MAEREERTAEDVRKVIKTAKLHESDLSGVSQFLRFADSQPENELLRLMQLDSTLLAEIEAGNQLVFKGEGNEDIVLCTDSKTYDVKEAETSNSLLLIPGLLYASDTCSIQNNNSIDSNKSTDSLNNSTDKPHDKSNSSLNKSTDSDDLPPRQIQEKEIVKTFFTYYELRPCKPRFAKLRKLLETSRYRGPEHEYAVEKSHLYNYQALFDKVQASNQELRQALREIQAFEVGGYYRLLEFDYEFRVLSYMLDLIEENSWELDQISKEVTMDSLKDLVPKEILEGMFAHYTEEASISNGVTSYRYKSELVCRFLARVLLKSAGKFNLQEFMQAWRDSVPEGMCVSEEMLSGIALIDKSSTPPVVFGFSEADLPESITDRFNVLFRTCDKWSVREIEPYISVYATDKMNVNALLTKYARASTHDGVRVFSAKHSK